MELNPEKISVNFVSLVFCFLLALSPSFVLIYLVDKELFFKLDNYRLTTFALLITSVPILFFTLINSLIGVFVHKTYTTGKHLFLYDTIEKDFAYACILTPFSMLTTIKKVVHGTIPHNPINISQNLSANIILFALIWTIIHVIVFTRVSKLWKKKTHERSQSLEYPSDLPIDTHLHPPSQRKD